MCLYSHHPFPFLARSLVSVSTIPLARVNRTAFCQIQSPFLSSSDATVSHFFRKRLPPFSLFSGVPCLTGGTPHPSLPTSVSNFWMKDGRWEPRAEQRDGGESSDVVSFWLNPDFWFYLKSHNCFSSDRVPYKNHHHVISLRSPRMENNSHHNLTACGKRYLENHNYDLISDLFWKTLIVILLQNTKESAFRATRFNEHKSSHYSGPRK